MADFEDDGAPSNESLVPVVMDSNPPVFSLPHHLPSEVSPLSSAPLQVSQFGARRSTALKGLLQTTELAPVLKASSTRTGKGLYRANIALSKVGGKTYCRGFTKGVNGKIVQQVKLYPVGGGAIEMAASCTTQLMLLGVAIQLQQIQKKLEEIGTRIKDIDTRIHKNSLSKIIAGIWLLEDAKASKHEINVQNWLDQAIQTLLEGIASTYVTLGEEIGRVKAPKGREKLMRVPEAETQRAEGLAMAEETLTYAVAGMGALAQCYALKGEPEVARSRLRQLTDRIREAGVTDAYQKALTIKMSGQLAPEQAWASYLERAPMLVEHIDNLAPLAGGGGQPLCFEVEFSEEELEVQADAHL